MRMRVVLSGIAVAAWAVIDFFSTAAAPLISAPLAAHQFDNSSGGYFAALAGRQVNGSGGWWFLALLAVLLALWWKPIRRELGELLSEDDGDSLQQKNKRGPGIGPLVLLFFAFDAILAPAQAYYEKSDYAEPYYILPNQSAFWVPDNGANKDTQAQFGSEAYYRSNKIAAKLFIVPHVKLPDSGLWSNYYVPAGRLYIVDRSPYVREWTLPERGTNKTADEAFHCQTKEGLNITAEVTMAASVHDEDSPKYMWHFGVQAPAGDVTQPAVLFTSVLYSKSLTQIMDTVGKNAIGSLVCDEFSTRTFNQANSDMALEMKEIRQKGSALLGSWGITVDFMGWDGTFTFDGSVQQAINNAYEASVIGPELDILKSYADINVKQGLAKGLGDHGLPANMIVIPTDILSKIGGSFLGGDEGGHVLGHSK